MSEQKQLSKFKKAELQGLASHLGLDTEGVRNDIEGRILDLSQQSGGFEGLVRAGKLSDQKWISSLDLESSVPSKQTATTQNQEKQQSQSLMKKIESPIKKASKRIQAAEKAAVSRVPAWFSFHTPAAALDFLSEHLSVNKVQLLFTDLRNQITSADTIVLILVYLEFAALVYSHIGWSAQPLFSIPLPQWCHGVCHHVTEDGKMLYDIKMPIFAGLLSRKQFLYPLFYWFVYYVAIPSVIGWLVNLQNRSGRLICPVNMLTFSYVRLLLFIIMLKSVSVDGLLSGDPQQLTHRSLTVLFDGAHLPVKLFLSSCVTGILYAFYENH